MQQSIAVMALLMVACVSQSSTGNVAAGENAQLFNQLCTLIGVAEAKIEIGSEAEETNAIDAEIQQLNMSFSTPDWQSIFKSGTGEDDWQQTVPTNFSSHKTWSAQWPRWLKAAQAHASDKQQQKLKNRGALQLEQHQKLYLSRKLRVIASKSAELASELKMLKVVEQADAAKNAAKNLKIAAYGADRTAAGPLVGAEVFKGAGKDTAQACCENTAADKVTETISGTIICVCAGGANLKTVCVNPQTELSQWSDGQTGAATQWTTLAKHCTHKVTSEKPEEILDSTLQSIKAAIKTDDSHAYLGAYRQTGCQASQNTGFCVKYTNDKRGTSTLFDSMAWVKTVGETVTALRQSREATQRARAIKKELALLETQLQAAIDAAKTVTAAPPIQVTGGAPTPAGNSETSDECKQYKPKKTCEENGCKWEGTEEKGESACKAKPEEQKKQFTDGAVATKTDKCKGKLEGEFTNALG
ncbi:variant surface glycoprotein (VSG), putative [Trypanosoma brucei brucei TREU927]|uniref:Variant surface glycoprotein (VSG), putative n=2 Tax=Trypanosoma brucei TaxID=5691 RepID=Q22KU0_TRYB2|nr:variant surface glycoprotein [Trypanosoma brucei brucei TREU927]AGH59934.1 variant surface glycoprotein 768 [Trypanosoma brucei]EAN78990.1 variant surface glycoprotein (VSG), putative [Trypanosoma brucei brucei TREU927]